MNNHQALKVTLTKLLLLIWCFYLLNLPSGRILYQYFIELQIVINKIKFNNFSISFLYSLLSQSLLSYTILFALLTLNKICLYYLGSHCFKKRNQKQLTQRNVITKKSTQFFWREIIPCLKYVKKYVNIGRRNNLYEKNITQANLSK